MAISLQKTDAFRLPRDVHVRLVSIFRHRPPSSGLSMEVLDVSKFVTLWNS
jgi:hypothetical protein